MRQTRQMPMIISDIFIRIDGYDTIGMELINEYLDMDGFQGVDESTMLRSLIRKIFSFLKTNLKKTEQELKNKFNMYLTEICSLDRVKLDPEIVKEYYDLMGFNAEEIIYSNERVQNLLKLLRQDKVKNPDIFNEYVKNILYYCLDKEVSSGSPNIDTIKLIRAEVDVLKGDLLYEKY